MRARSCPRSPSSRSCAAGAPRACRSRSGCSASSGRSGSPGRLRTHSGRCARSPPTRPCARCRCSRSRSRRLRGWRWASPARGPRRWLVGVLAVVDRACRSSPTCWGTRLRCCPALAHARRAGPAALAPRAGRRAGVRARSGRAGARSRAPRLPAAESAPAGGELAAGGRRSRARPRPRATCSPAAPPRGRRASRRSPTTSRCASSCASGARPRYRDLLLDMAGTRYGLEDVAGYDPVQLLVYRDAITASNGNPQPDRHFLWVEVGPSGACCGCSACATTSRRPARCRTG